MICRLYSLIIFVGGLLGQENVDQGGGFLTKADKFYQQQENIFQIVDDNYINSSPCCGQINITADAHHGVWMIHFNKLGSYTVTNTLVRGRLSWVSDTDPEFLISWCGDFWHIGHRSQAGQCAGYLSSPDNNRCFDMTRAYRHYVHCINEWVSAAPSNIRVECLDSVTDLTNIPGIVPKGQEFTDRIQQLSDQQKKDLDIDPRNLDAGRFDFKKI